MGFHFSFVVEYYDSRIKSFRNPDLIGMYSSPRYTSLFLQSRKIRSNQGSLRDLSLDVIPIPMFFIAAVLNARGVSDGHTDGLTQHSIVQHSVVQHSVGQYSVVQHSVGQDALFRSRKLRCEVRQIRRCDTSLPHCVAFLPVKSYYWPDYQD